MLFPKKPKVTDPVTTSADLNTSADQTANLALIAGLQTQVSALNAQVAQYENFEKLSAKAEKLGFVGNLGELFAENNYDYSNTLEAMFDGKIDKETEEKVANNKEAFLKTAAHNPSVGSGGEETAPETRAQAISDLRASNPKMTLREATAKAREAYPTLK